MSSFTGQLVMQNRIMDVAQEKTKQTETLVINLGNDIAVETKKRGVTPWWTGATNKSTRTSYDFKPNVKLGRITQNTDYIPKIYEFGGIKPTGIPFWLNKAAERVEGKFGVMALAAYDKK